MATLKRFRQNSAAINRGEWVDLGIEFDNLEIRSRGLTDAYWDMHQAKIRRAAQAYNDDANRIPNAIRREINVDCLVDHAILDVRNLYDDDGHPVTLDGFCDLLRNPDFHELIVACFRAAGWVGRQRQAEIDDAAGPLATPSAIISNGDSMPS